MVRFAKLFAVTAALVAFVAVAQARAEKEKTLTGTITCAKCDLHKSRPSAPPSSRSRKTARTSSTTSTRRAQEIPQQDLPDADRGERHR